MKHLTVPVWLSKKGGGCSSGDEKTQNWGWRRGSHSSSTAITSRGGMRNELTFTCAQFTVILYVTVSFMTSTVYTPRLPCSNIIVKSCFTILEKLFPFVNNLQQLSYYCKKFISLQILWSTIIQVGHINLVLQNWLILSHFPACLH